MPPSFAAGRKRSTSLLGAIAALVLFGPLVHAADPVRAEVRDGDRVVLVGGTFIERDQYYGYLETILTTRLPDRNFTVRNLGWSGDTVTGISRARFGPVAEGYEHLISHVEALKPTLLIVAYGGNESFEGEAGLPQFRDGLNTLLDNLSKTHPRIVLLSPIKQEKKPAPLPDPAKHNEDLRFYSEAIRDTAEQRNMAFVDLYNLVPMNTDSNEPMTDNGIHLRAYGYWRVGEILANELGAPMTPARWDVVLDETGKPLRAEGATTSDVQAADRGFSFTVTPKLLRLPVAPPAEPPLKKQFQGNQIVVKALPDGRLTLIADGKKLMKSPGSPAGIDRFGVSAEQEDSQVEAVRSLINAKNRLYFYRWRPQNETYLFGFRKHEQGKNGAEIPQFDPLVAELEEKIATLRKPKPHTYELIREGEVAR